MEWAEVVDNPLLQDLPFKIELNKFGKLLMSPASNHHASIQGRLAAILFNKLPEGEVLTECSIETSDGVKVADVAWLSNDFINEFSYTTPYPKAPEICVEISTKVDLYLAKGAHEVWVVYDLNKIDIYTNIGKIDNSKIVSSIKLA